MPQRRAAAELEQARTRPSLARAPRRSRTISPNARARRASGSRPSSARSRSGRESRRPRGRSRRRASGSRSRRSRSSPGSSGRSLPRSRRAPPPCSPPESEHAFALLERARARGSEALDVLDRAPPRHPARPGARPLAGSRRPDEALRLLGGVWLVEARELLDARSGIVVTPGGTATTRSAESSGLPGRRARRCCSSSTPAGVRSPTRPTSSTRARAATREAEEAAARAEAEAAYPEVAHLRAASLDAALLGRL